MSNRQIVEELTTKLMRKLYEEKPESRGGYWVELECLREAMDSNRQSEIPTRTIIHKDGCGFEDCGCPSRLQTSHQSDCYSGY
jgi:hypothetical protein